MLFKSIFVLMPGRCISNVEKNKSAAQRKPLFAAFIDFEEAYDSVDRQLLWTRLLANPISEHEPL
jgi:hypothetical protein